LNLALAGTKQSFKLRHTQSVDGKIQMAREALGMSFTYMDKFEQEAKALFEQEVTEKQFIDIVKGIYPKPEKSATKAQLTKWDNKMVLISDLYNNSPTNANIKGTAWGVFNALTERLDYFKQERKNNLENRLASASGFDAMSNAEKNKLFTKVKSLAGVA
jgi:isopenicillin N synthase-like dioxygenase